MTDHPDPTAVLLGIARAVSSALNLRELYELIVQRTATACGADVCSICLSRRPRTQTQAMTTPYLTGRQAAGTEQAR